MAGAEGANPTGAPLAGRRQPPLPDDVPGLLLGLGGGASAPLGPAHSACSAGSGRSEAQGRAGSLPHFPKARGSDWLCTKLKLGRGGSACPRVWPSRCPAPREGTAALDSCRGGSVQVSGALAAPPGEVRQPLPPCAPPLPAPPRREPLQAGGTPCAWRLEHPT